MESKINIEEYLNLIEAQFDDNIDGERVLKLTKSKQINLFILKNIYDEWKNNFEKNKLKFFNYEKDEIKDALSNLMNELSYNIKLDKNTTIKFLKKSIYDCIALSDDPIGFIKSDILKDPEFSMRSLQNRSKYFHYYGYVFNYLINIFPERDELFSTINKIEFKDESKDLRSEITSTLNIDLEEIISKKRKGEDFLSLFPRDTQDVKDLIIKAESKNCFEDASIYILKRMREEYKNNPNEEKVRKLLQKIYNKYQ